MQSNIIFFGTVLSHFSHFYMFQSSGLSMVIEVKNSQYDFITFG